MDQNSGKLKNPPQTDTMHFTIDNSAVRYEFHIAKSIRKKYNLEQELFSITGNVIFANFSEVRKFAITINSGRETKDHIKPGEINAVGLIDEMYHFILNEYEKTVNPGVFGRALDHLKKNYSDEQITKLLFDFVEVFPPSVVFSGKASAFEYLNSFTSGQSNLEICLEEIILLYFANENPANKKLKELFDSKYLQTEKIFENSITELDNFFKKEPPFGPDEQDIFELFLTPLKNFPDDLEAQLNFIMSRWEIIVGQQFSRRILSSKDLMKEDITFDNMGGGGGSAPVVVPQYKGKVDLADILVLGKSSYKYGLDSHLDYEEPEQFTKDIDWMPRVVLMAKNIYVWLDQLSKKYKRNINTLDQIPNEELDELARWNFTGLWLIGVWERSNASKKIKHLMGNIDAVASAYSLYDYHIAADLGGDEAYENLNNRAKIRGIRLASDMVPNHTGIYSNWVIEHPDYYIQSDEPPFPNYKFTGEDLSTDSRVQLRIEDSYYNHSDAAVVFQRIDNATGEVKYFYHGNDGTNMPWNDTAQLNYLKKEVREAVIQKIFDVARKFSIIRFDAAMTLTKRHFSRLWFPEPGKGGDIPSRAEHALTKKEFDEFFPLEFWREVVDRINDELPDTLLLAEAFWLMEGYFVRSLGMHRVYNSAFMHMMMKEENSKYHNLITNTLEFEPEILKRYVNFMSNPDEETAIKQFGVDDKYFGATILMITLPGLPMFAHGQIEGYTEKYGMEYKRAYYKETPNTWLVERHQKEVFPLMRKRYLFSQVENFWFFKFFDTNGGTNENVFAYSNVYGAERAVVVYNNKYISTNGRIFQSTPKLTGEEGSDRQLQSKTIAEALNINSDHNQFYIYRESISNLEYLKSGSELAFNGLQMNLAGFEYRIFIDFREVYDHKGDYAELSKRIDGTGVPDIRRAHAEMILEPVHEAFENLFDKEIMKQFLDIFVKMNGEDEKLGKIDLIPAKTKYQILISRVRDHYNLETKLKPISKVYLSKINSTIDLVNLIADEFDVKKDLNYVGLKENIIVSGETNYRENLLMLLMYFAVSTMKEMVDVDDKIKSETFIDQLLLATPVKSILGRLGRGEVEIFNEITLLNILLDQRESIFDIDKIISSFDGKKKVDCAPLRNKIKSEKADSIIEMLNDEYIKSYIGINYFEDVWYYSKEKFCEILNWEFTLSLIDYLEKEKDQQKEPELDKELKSDEVKKKDDKPVKTKKAKGKKVEEPEEDKLHILIKETFRYYKHLEQLAKISEYKLESLKVLLNNDKLLKRKEPVTEVKKKY